MPEEIAFQQVWTDADSLMALRTGLTHGGDGQHRFRLAKDARLGPPHDPAPV